MVALSGREIDRYLAKPDPTRPVAVIYGSDTGLVAERCSQLVAHYQRDTTDPFSLVKIDGDTIADDPGRLIDEVGTLSMFGGRRTLWIKPTSRTIIAAVEQAVDALTSDTAIVLELGDVRKSHPLVQWGDRHASAAVIACYSDSVETLNQLVTGELSKAGLRADSAVREHLVALLGGDRQATRAELEKLLLYAHGEAELTMEMVDDAVGDVSSTLVGDAIDAAFEGRAADLETLLPKLLAAGFDPGVVIAFLVRQTLMLHRVKSLLGARTPPDLALRQAGAPRGGPPLARFNAIVRRWPVERLEEYIPRLHEALFEARRNAETAGIILSRLLLSIANVAASLRPNGR